MEEVSVVVLSARVLQNVLGASDIYLRKIRKALGVRVVVDAEKGKLFVRSEDAESARKCAYLLEQLQRWTDRDGQALSNDDVNRAIDEVLQGQPVSQTPPFEVYGGKTIRPKTAGQARYCEALREHEIVFCSGPAGTGKTYLAAARAPSKRSDLAKRAKLSWCVLRSRRAKISGSCPETFKRRLTRT